MIYGIILAGGSGKRAGADIPKQYIEINQKPLLYYTLKAFEESAVDAVSVVADEAHLQFVIGGIVDRFRLKKVLRVCQGGAERFHSVHHGLDDLGDIAAKEDIVLIHDGARPFIRPAEIDAIAEAVKEHGAAIAAMPVKDTIKTSDDSGFVAATTVRTNTWQIQTPQGFRYGLLRNAYDRAAKKRWKLPAMDEGQKMDKTLTACPGKLFTDDAMVLEAVCPEQKIKLVPTSYDNLKITTAADLEVAKAKLK